MNNRSKHKTNMNNIQIFSYNDNPVSFQTGGSEMLINATQMAKSFGKQPSDWTRTKQSKEFLSTLSAVRGICGTDLIRIEQGGNSTQGTWFHKDIAMEFARWLSPAFSIWCNDRIFELLRFGITATPEVLLKAASDPQFVLRMLNQVREGYEKGVKLEAKVAQLSEKLNNQVHKVNFYDKVQTHKAISDSNKVYRVTRIAGELGLRAVYLNKFLEERGIQVKRGGIWVLTTPYRNMSYTKLSSYPKKRFEDDDECVVYTVWTQAGREFILSLFEQVDDSSWQLTQ